MFIVYLAMVHPFLHELDVYCKSLTEQKAVNTVNLLVTSAVQHVVNSTKKRSSFETISHSDECHQTLHNFAARLYVVKHFL